MTPTERTLRKLRADGWLVAVVEKWNPAVKRRVDLFGVVDVLALRGEETLAVQATSDNGGNVSARVKKIADHESTPAIRAAGWGFVVHGWKKGKNGRWQCREVDVS